MSRILGRGRYIYGTYPQGPGGGGGAGGASVPLTRQRFIDGGTVQAGLNGAAAEPFKTIEQFTTERDADLTSSNNARANFVGWVMPAVLGYVEDVAFPAYASTELRADSMSLAGGTIITGNLGWNNTAGPFVPDNSAVVAVHNLTVTGNFTVTDDVGAPASVVCLSGDEASGGASAILAGAFVSNTTVHLADAIFNNVQVLGGINCGAGVDNAAVILTGGTIVTGGITARVLSCDDAAIGSGAVTVNTAGFAQFHNTAFSGAVVLTAAVSNFDGSSWISFLENGGTRAVGTTVLVEGGYNGGAVEGAALTNADVSVALNGTGATAGFTGENSGNHYTSSVTLTAGRTVSLLTAGALPGDTMLITRNSIADAFTLTVHNSGPGANTIGVIPVSARGFVLARFDGTNWVFAAGGSMLA